MPRKRISTERKTVDKAGALRLRRAWNRAGETVVFTNGVFDILHPGHVALLEKAKGFGGKLIVGVNTDASTRRLNKKGPKRPINPLASRIRVLAALEAVDAAVPFGEDTPEKLLSVLKPDILVKGADYKKHEVAGKQHAKTVKLVALKKGHSTTDILARL